MKVIRHKFSKYKGSPDIEVNYKGAGVYCVYGPNESGKSSFLENGISLMTAKEKAITPVTLGENTSINMGDYIDANGNKAEVTKSIDAATGKIKFDLIYKELMSNKVGDIKNIFKFNGDLTAEKFIALGLTAKGKREQFDYVLQILSETDKKSFLDLKATEANIFEKRTTANKLVDTLKASVEINTVTEEENNKIALKEKAEKFIEAAITQIANADKIDLEKETLKKGKKSFKSIIDSIAIENFSTQLQAEFDTVTIKIEEEYDLKINELKSVNTEELSTKVDKYKIGLKNIAQYEIRKGLLTDYQDKLIKATKEQTELNNKLEVTREKIETFFTDKKFPIPELIIKNINDGLFINTPDGILPFNEDQLSTSQIMMITLKIMYFVNKGVDIIYLGKLESFGRKKIKTLIEFAKEYDVQIITDKVNEDDNAPFVVEILLDTDEKEILVSVPLNKEPNEPKDIPTKIEKRKSEGKVNADKKEVKIKEVLTNEEKKNKEDDILEQDDIF